MLDIHTHILPAMDDGSKSAQQSAAMLRSLSKQGVSDVVLTPHFYAHREAPESFFKRRAESARALEEGLAGKGKFPHLYLGAEVAFFKGMSQADDIDRFCIGNSDAILVEMPFSKWSQSIIDELCGLRDYAGLQPILAHIERYLRFQPSGIVEELCEAGFLIQANAGFFSGWLDSMKAMRLLKKGCIHFIGSDCHDMEKRPPDIGAAMENINKKLGEPAIQYLRRMERMLLEGE